MTQITQHPYAGLTPDLVLDALECAGIRSDGRLLALNSYENRVYRAGVEGRAPIVVKFYRPGRWSSAAILEEHAFLEELSSGEIPAIPPMQLSGGGTLLEYGGYRFSVFSMCGGRAPELEDRLTLEWLGRYIGRIHAVGARSTFRHRPAIDMNSFGEEPLAYLGAQQWLPADLATAYFSVARQALDGVGRAFDRAGIKSLIRLHGDCHAGNVLWTEAGPHFVDFDDSRMGPAVQDLWMLLSGERSDMTRQISDILAGYEDFSEFDRRELHLIEALRTLRMMHYSAWLARRWDDPAFPSAFPWFGTQHYWQNEILALREQIALMEEPPLQV